MRGWWNTEGGIAYRDVSHVCACVGPEPGHDLCPCMERGKAEDRRALEEQLIKEGWTPPGAKPKVARGKRK